MKLTQLKTLLLPLVAFLTINVLTVPLAETISQSVFQRLLIHLSVFSLSLVAFFIIVARHIIPSQPSKRWIKLLGIVFAIVLLYTTISLTVGDRLLNILDLVAPSQLEDSPVFEESLIEDSPVFEESLTLVMEQKLMLGLYFIPNAIVTLMSAYALQKFMVRAFYRVYRRISGCKKFFFDTKREVEPSVVVYALWLILLPFPIEYALSKATGGGLVLGPVSSVVIMPAALVIFALWGLRASRVVGSTIDSVLRLSEMLKGSLFALTAVQWFSFVIYVIFTEADPVHGISTIVTLLASSVFLHGPTAIIVAYFYLRFLHGRAEEQIVEYLSEEEGLVESDLTILVETAASQDGRPSQA